MLQLARVGFLSFVALWAQAASADFVTTAAEVISFTRGPGLTHPNFLDATSALGAPDYVDPAHSGFGTGAVSLGQGGVLILQMAAAFTIGNSSAADLFIHEIGPSQGGSSEATKVEISKNGLDWLVAGTTPGGTSGLNLDALLGLTRNDLFRFVRLTDTTRSASKPAGADIDAVVAVTAVPLPNGLVLAVSGLFLLAAKGIRRRREA